MHPWQATRDTRMLSHKLSKLPVLSQPLRVSILGFCSRYDLTEASTAPAQWWESRPYQAVAMHPKAAAQTSFMATF